ncbi:hypothetical protein [Sphingobium cloacae]|uniref:Uncharacterized protein n=1 Tax=Sphingobium cloacae TaxID=120107 RepID=A0A1E1EYQ1_9SPHN|nr:hypothetical protein [Sphingobium cloacae]BAV63387.1 hypothetical protein SCLO_1003470 [Sphingobium cloacae]
MTIYVRIPADQPSHQLREVVAAAARCWRSARDAGAPVQQRLYAMLAPRDFDMLAPVFDSLMRLCEASLGRPVAAGGPALSDDERLLVGLLDGSKVRTTCVECADGIASAFDCAIRSTRIMLTNPITILAGSKA